MFRDKTRTIIARTQIRLMHICKALQACSLQLKCSNTLVQAGDCSKIIAAVTRQACLTQCGFYVLYNIWFFIFQSTCETQAAHSEQPHYQFKQKIIQHTRCCISAFLLWMKPIPLRNSIFIYTNTAQSHMLCAFLCFTLLFFLFCAIRAFFLQLFSCICGCVL